MVFCILIRTNFQSDVTITIASGVNNFIVVFDTNGDSSGSGSFENL